MFRTPAANRRAISRVTFADMLAQAAPVAAKRLFDKAVSVSRLRRLAKAQGSRKAARAWGKIKLGLLKQATAICPHHVRVRAASDDPTRLLSVRYRDGRSPHVPRNRWENA